MSDTTDPEPRPVRGYIRREATANMHIRISAEAHRALELAWFTRRMAGQRTTLSALIEEAIVYFIAHHPQAEPTLPPWPDAPEARKQP